MPRRCARACLLVALSATWLGASPAATAQPDAPNPAEAAFQRGTALLAEHCQAARAAYERGDRRPSLLSLAADCYLIEAEVWRAQALHDDARRLRGAAEAELPPPDAIDLAALHESWRGACDEFEQSLTLEPSAGAQLAVALCRIRGGKLATSRQLLDGMLPQLTALAAGGDAFHKNRLALAQALLAEIDRVQPSLTIELAAPDDRAARDLALTLDGRPVATRAAQHLDAGTYQLGAAGAGASAETAVTLAPGTHTVARLELTPRRTHRGYTLAALGLAGASALAVVGGSVAWWRAEALLDDLEASGGQERQEGFDCPNARCRELAEDVNTTRTLRGVAFALGAGTAAAAVVVHLLTPPVRPTALRWLPAVERDAVSLSVQGGF